MATTLKLRRGTTAAHATFTGAVGEVTVDTDKDVVVVHDGATAGGFPLLGATTPQVLSVNSTSDALRITQTGTGNALLVEDSANPDSTPFVVNADGRVVIGTTTPITAAGVNAGLQTHGAGLSFGSIQASVSAADSTSAGSLYLAKSRGAIGAFDVVSNGDTLGVMNFVGADGSAYIRGASIQAAVDGTPGTNDMPGRLVFSTTADGSSTPTERMRIRNQGSIGIGTTGDASIGLRVGKAVTGATSSVQIQALGAIQSDVTANGSYYTTSASTQATSFTLTNLNHFSAAQSTIGAGSTVTNQYGFHANSTLTGATNNYGFYSNIASGTGRFNFYANGTANNYFAGNVGIGTTSPGAKLDVRGSSTFLVNATNPTAWISVDSALTTGSMYNQWNTTSNVGISGTYTNHPYTFVTNNTERMRISATGNVGIGTTSPGNSLQVSRAGADVARFTNTQSNGGDWQFKIGGGGFEDRKLLITDKFSGADNVRVAVDSSGNVGIGTSSPSYLLDVQRTAANGTGVLDVLRLRSTADSAGDGPRLLMTCGNSTTGGAGIGAGGVALNSANLLFYAGGNTERARIASNGDFTIASTTLYITNIPTTATAGNCLISAGEGNKFYRSTSSLKYKRNVVDMQRGIADVQQLRPVNFNGVSDFDGDKLFAGFIAEEVEALNFKEFVIYDENGEPDGLQYANMVALLTKAIQEQQQMIETLQAEVAALKGA